MAAPLSPFLRVMAGEALQTPPVWMMRQAGRHLAEYRELRAKARDFLDFCYSPSLAAEATLQPVRRYGMDAAILFADILLILDAMGRGVRFVEGVGPLVEPATQARELAATPLSVVRDRLAPVSETVSRVKAALPADKALIGFCGAPWTVAVYAIEGKGGGDKSDARLFGYRNPDELDGMLRILTEASVDYLEAQAKAGADALMIFDSWSEGLSDAAFERWVVAPTRALVAGLRARGVTQPVIGFPRGAGANVLSYARSTGVTAMGLDTAIPLGWAQAELPPGLVVQGNLDPMLLVAGGDAMDARVREIRDAFAGRPHVFNLGHGVTPETPIAHVERVLEILRERV